MYVYTMKSEDIFVYAWWKCVHFLLIIGHWTRNIKNISTGIDDYCAHFNYETCLIIPTYVLYPQIKHIWTIKTSHIHAINFRFVLADSENKWRNNSTYTCLERYTHSRETNKGEPTLKMFIRPGHGTVRYDTVCFTLIQHKFLISILWPSASAQCTHRFNIFIKLWLIIYWPNIN